MKIIELCEKCGYKMDTRIIDRKEYNVCVSPLCENYWIKSGNVYKIKER